MNACPHGLIACHFTGYCPEGVGCRSRASLVLRGHPNARAARDAMEAREAAVRLDDGGCIQDTDPAPVSLALDNEKACEARSDRWSIALLGWLTFLGIILAVHGAWWWLPISFAVAMLNAHNIRTKAP